MGGANKCNPFRRGGPGVATADFFLYILIQNPELVHSLAPKIGSISVYQDPCGALGDMKTVGRGCGMRPEAPKIAAEGRERGGVLGRGQQAPPARGSGSDANKTKILRPKPRPN